jgi:nucleoid DNA-binding protein
MHKITMAKAGISPHQMHVQMRDVIGLRGAQLFEARAKPERSWSLGHNAGSIRQTVIEATKIVAFLLSHRMKISIARIEK